MASSIFGPARRGIFGTATALPPGVLPQDPLMAEYEEQPQTSPSLLRQAANVSLSGLSMAGNFLDTPASVLRDLATWVPGGIPAQNPIDQLFNPFTSTNRVSGEQLLQSAGLLGKGPTSGMGSFGRFVAGTGLEILADPLTYATFGASALGKGGKLARAAGLMDDATKVATRKLGKKVGKNRAKQSVSLRELIDGLSSGGDDAINVSDKAAMDAAGVTPRQVFEGRILDAYNAGKRGADRVTAFDELPANVLDDALGGNVRWKFPFMQEAFTNALPLPSQIPGAKAAADLLPRGLRSLPAGRAAPFLDSAANVLQTGVDAAFRPTGSEGFADAMDVVGDAVYYGKYSPVRPLRAVFDRMVRGAKEGQVQKDMGPISRLVEEQSQTARDAMYDLVKNIEASGVFEGPNAIRNGNAMMDYLEGISKELPQEFNDLGITPFVDRARDLNRELMDLKQQYAVNIEPLGPTGIKQDWLDEAGNPMQRDIPSPIEHFPRMLQLETGPVGRALHNQTRLPTRDGFSIARDPNRRHLPTSVIQDMSLNLKYAGVYDAGFASLRKKLQDQFKGTPDTGTLGSDVVDPAAKKALKEEFFKEYDPLQYIDPEYYTKPATNRVESLIDDAIRNGNDNLDYLRDLADDAEIPYKKTDDVAELTSKLRKSRIDDKVVGEINARHSKLFDDITKLDRKQAEAQIPTYAVNPLRALMEELDSGYQTIQTTIGLRNLAAKYSRLREGSRFAKEPAERVERDRVAGEVAQVFGDKGTEFMPVMEARAKTWAAETGKKPDEWFKRVAVRRGDFDPNAAEDVLNQAGPEATDFASAITGQPFRATVHRYGDSRAKDKTGEFWSEQLDDLYSDRGEPRSKEITLNNPFVLDAFVPQQDLLRQFAEEGDERAAKLLSRSKQLMADDMEEADALIREKLMAQGYDGAIYRGDPYQGGNEVVVFGNNTVGKQLPVGGGQPPQSGLVPTIVQDGKIYYGQPGDTHADVIRRYRDLDLETVSVQSDRNDVTGFAGPDGRQLDREAALKFARQQRPGVADVEGKLDSADYNEAMQMRSSFDPNQIWNAGKNDRQHLTYKGKLVGGVQKQGDVYAAQVYSESGAPEVIGRFADEQAAKDAVARRFSSPDVLYQGQTDSLAGMLPGAPGFYSQLSRVVDQKVGGKVGWDQFQATMKKSGVKDEEIEDMGLKEFFAGGTKTKAEIQKHLEENAIEINVRENTRGTTYDAYRVPGGDFASYREMLITKPVAGGNPRKEKADYVAKLREKYGNEAINNDGSINEWQYDFSLTSDEADMIELLDQKIVDQEVNKNVYKGPHFKTPNVLAHFRIDDVTLPNGKKELRVQEVQSDWHQAATEAQQDAIAEFAGVPRKIDGKANPAFKEWKKQNEQIVKEQFPVNDFYMPRDSSHPYYAAQAKVDKIYDEISDLEYEMDRHMRASSFEKWHELKDQVKLRRNDLYDAIDAMNKVRPKTEIPDAPFKDSWHMLALKNVLKIAAEEGYDSVSIVKGADIAQAVSGPKDALGTFYDKILTGDLKKYTKRWGSYLGESNVPIDSTPINWRPFRGDGAEAVLENGDRWRVFRQDGRWHTDIQAEDGFSVSGIANQTFATKDEAIAAILKDIDYKGEYTGDVQVFQITDKMRKDLLEQGQPLYQRRNAEPRGQVEFLAENQSIITAFNGADVSTLAHETAHIFRRDLPENLLQQAAKALNVKDWKSWTREDEEAFARGFENYMATGKAPVKELETVFEKFKTWLTNIYRSIVGTPLEEQISPQLREVFDKALSGGPQKELFGDSGKFVNLFSAELDRPGYLNIAKMDYDSGMNALTQALGPDAVRVMDGLKEERLAEVGNHLESVLTKGNVDFDADTFMQQLRDDPENVQTLIEQIDDDTLRAAAEDAFGSLQKPVDPRQVLQEFEIDAKLAADLARVNKYFSAPEEVNAFAAAWDAMTNLFKGNVTAPFPSFHFRNILSGFVQNTMQGIYDPTQTSLVRQMIQPYVDAKDLVNGGTIKDAAEIPMLRRMLDDHIAAKPTERPLWEIDGFKSADEWATDQVRRLLFSRKLTGSPGAQMDLAANHSGNMSSEIIGLTPIKDEFKRPEGATLLQTLNPLATPGVMGNKNTFAPVRWGRGVGDLSEKILRSAPFIALLKQGIDPDEAARMVKRLHVDYSDLTNVERNVIRRAVPFYSFQKGSTKFLATELAQRPGGAVGQSIRIAENASGDDPGAPAHVRAGLNVPIWQSRDGDPQYLVGAGLMHEPPLQMLGPGIGPTLFNVGSMLHPAIKAPLELLTNASLFQEGPDGGGRSLNDLDPLLGRTMSNVVNFTGLSDREVPYRPLGKVGEALIANSPAARYLHQIRKATDPRKDIFTRLLDGFTGFKIETVNSEDSDAVLREQAETLLRELGGRQFRTAYIPENVLATLAPQQQAEARGLMELLREINARQKQRNKEEKEG